MDLRRAMTYVFDDPRWYAKLGKAGAMACLPLIGPLLLLPALALGAIRAAAKEDERIELPNCRLDGATLIAGCKCQLLMVIASFASAVLTFPFWASTAGDTTSTSDSAGAAPGLISAFQSPSYLLVAVVFAVLSAVCLARFAVTGSVWAAFNVAAIWSHLRAEPAIWIAAAVVGLAIEEAPLSLAWLLPSNMQITAVLIASALFWPFAMLVQAHLIGQAHRWSAQTLARRRVLIVKVRW